MIQMLYWPSCFTISDSSFSGLYWPGLRPTSIGFRLVVMEGSIRAPSTREVERPGCGSRLMGS